MSSANQRTLFQTWSASLCASGASKMTHCFKKAPQRQKVGTNENQDKSQKREKENAYPSCSLWAEVGRAISVNQSPQEARELDDDLMLIAADEAEKSLENRVESVADASKRGSAGIHADLPGYDSSSGKVWIYPTNFPARDYQLKISEAALFQNTLVCLPTGLGKTFIAAVVMYNFYRWYPSGRIVFMAPTKPLVAQQIEACYKVMGIPQQHMAELTGSIPALQRRELWRSRRVFFLTPQVMMNDLSRNTCPRSQVKCVVIDEAHKALGNHAYCQVVRELWNQTKQFRVLALSATPGGDIKAVQQVISNLLISHIELRSEESPDIQAYSHQRTLEKIVVPLGESLTEYQTRYLQVLEKFTSRLTQMRVLNHYDLHALTKYQLILAREQFRCNPPPHIMGAQHGVLEGDFAMCISLYHGYELLQQMGLRSLFLFTQNIILGSKESSRARNELQHSPVFMALYRDMEDMFLALTKGPNEQYFYSHPKLQKLDEVVQQHFSTWSENSGSCPDSGNISGGINTRVIIFSSFRESVQEIAEMLNRHQPLIRVMTFMGQASAGKGVRGFTQKEQLEVVHRFRNGGFNVLVSTCVGEEGLDIGEVDLIVCFDAQKSPIRLIQRMGRTGRRRQGRIVIILAEGREERTYNQSQSNRRKVNKCITGNKHSFQMFPHSPRMLPIGVTPTLHKMHITCGNFESKHTNHGSIKGRQSLPRDTLSLLNPPAQEGGEQECVKEDSFLNLAEQALWTSTMKLQENEPQPVLRQSSFLSVSADSQPHEVCVQSLVRDLSLWEWRHWQNRPLPTHRVEHSSRCLHFTTIMDLLDRMKLREEADYKHDTELIAHLQKEDVVGCKDDSRVPKKTRGKAPQQKRSKATFLGQDFRTPISTAKMETKEVIDEEESKTHTTLSASLTSIKRKVSSDNGFDIIQGKEGLNAFQCSYDSSAADMNVANGISGHSKVKLPAQEEQLQNCSGDSQGESIETKPDPPCNLHSECSSLEDMFYLPKWNVYPTLHHLKQYSAALRIILSNVKKFLSTPPPGIFGLTCLFNNQPAGLGEPKDTCYDPVEEIDQFQDFNIEADQNYVHSDFVKSNMAADLPEPSDAPEINLKLALLPGNRLSYGPAKMPNSPSWDVLFDDGLDGKEAYKKTDVLLESKKHVEFTDLDVSVNLFGDDEAFLQVTLPEIDTLKKTSVISNRQDVPQCGQTTPGVRHASNSFNPSYSSESLMLPQPIEKLAHQKNSEAFDLSQDIFSVNFDLGFYLDSDEEETAEQGLSMATRPMADGEFPSLPLIQTSEPTNFTLGIASTPKVCSMDRKAVSSLMAKTNLSPIVTESKNLVKSNASTPTPAFASSNCTSLKIFPKEWSSQAQPCGTDNTSFRQSLLQTEKTLNQDPACSGTPSSDSEDEVVIRKQGHQGKVNPLASPESEESEAESVYDFKQTSVTQHKVSRPCKRSHTTMKSKKAMHREGKQFLDEEAELSEEGGSASSDEYDGEELDQSLQGFVVDTTQFSQGLNDSEMHGFYLKSVKSPAIGNKFRMVYKSRCSKDIFSQVPEQDETYAEDSFVVSGSELEEVGSAADEEEEEAEVEIMPEDSYVDGRRLYATRHRIRLRQTRTTGEMADLQTKVPWKTKRSRIVQMEDSSDSEEEGEGKKRKMLLAEETCISERPDEKSFKALQLHSLPGFEHSQNVERSTKQVMQQQEEMTRQKFRNQALLSEKLDFKESLSTSLVTAQAAGASFSVADGPVDFGVSIIQAPASPPCVSILVDSHCISSGAEIVSSLRLKHGAAVQVCSLVNCDFIVSNRMAVEWQSESDIANPQSRKRLQDRIQSLQALFDRVCFIVEKDRTKPGEPLRSFQRSRYYDSTVAALVRAGIRLLVSQGPEDTAALLAELAQVELRNGQAICVPLEVKGPRLQALQFYLTLPCVTYINALYMCHRFSSVSHLVSSSVDALQAGAYISRSRAEEIYRCLHYSCDTTLIKDVTSKNSL
ncbi:Fanconi anemia group M protein [Colossoma macropomum]|uniref:Fanconi anemia group M protein n=1 Tax=Colossoma macropomum TaxID=42526 RepID=UPI001863FCA0|nr:Fanconi anemia group M protein [Colossoma macropomum]